MKLVAIVPVRAGSQRLSKKNYIKVRGKRIFEHTLEKIIESKVFDRIVINSSDLSLIETAREYDVDFYERPSELSTSEATADQVVYDFMSNQTNENQFLVWVNTASPLTTLREIIDIGNFIHNEKPSSIVTVRKTRGHVLKNMEPINFKFEESLSRTQDMENLIEYNYAIMGWNYSCKNKLSSGQMFDAHTSFVESSFWSSILLKKDEDLKVIESLIESPIWTDIIWKK